MHWLIILFGSWFLVPFFFVLEAWKAWWAEGHPVGEYVTLASLIYSAAIFVVTLIRCGIKSHDMNTFVAMFVGNFIGVLSFWGASAGGGEFSVFCLCVAIPVLGVSWYGMFSVLVSAVEGGEYVDVPYKTEEYPLITM